MKPIIETIRGITFESMKYAAEYYKIPYSRLQQALKDDVPITYNGKSYYFRNYYGKILGASDVKVTKFMPLGKYRGMKITRITDLPYLEWMLENVDLAPPIRRKIREQVKELKARLT